MKKLVWRGAFAATLLAASSIVQAADEGSRGGLLVNLDLDYGGDDLATVSFTDGESQHVKAGQGFGFGVGGYFRPIASAPFELQALLGYKIVFTAADNADI